MKRKHKLILLAIILIVFIIIILSQALSPQNYFNRTIKNITQKEKLDEINAPKDFIKLIESIYTFSENSDFEKPRFHHTSEGTTEVEGTDYYSILFEARKTEGNGIVIDYKRLHIFVEMNRNFFNWAIVDYRILDNTFID